jgi:hypothetical protein
MLTLTMSHALRPHLHRCLMIWRFVSQSLCRSARAWIVHGSVEIYNIIGRVIQVRCEKHKTSKQKEDALTHPAIQGADEVVYSSMISPVFEGHFDFGVRLMLPSMFAKQRKQRAWLKRKSQIGVSTSHRERHRKYIKREDEETKVTVRGTRRPQSWRGSSTLIASRVSACLMTTGRFVYHCILKPFITTFHEPLFQWCTVPFATSLSKRPT